MYILTMQTINLPASATPKKENACPGAEGRCSTIELKVAIQLNFES
jgi:hypothetical protein